VNGDGKMTLVGARRGKQARRGCEPFRKRGYILHFTLDDMLSA
jgi:hypothetical protein